jgi:hypothetical protein
MTWTPTLDLIAEVLRQYERREQMYKDAGGNPHESHFRMGELTAYIPHEMILAVRRERSFAPSSSPASEPR